MLTHFDQTDLFVCRRSLKAELIHVIQGENDEMIVGEMPLGSRKSFPKPESQCNFLASFPWTGCPLFRLTRSQSRVLPWASAKAIMVTIARAQHNSSLFLIVITLFLESNNFWRAILPFRTLVPKPHPGSRMCETCKEKVSSIRSHSLEFSIFAIC